MTVSSFLEMTKTNKARLLIIITLANDRDLGRQQCKKAEAKQSTAGPFLRQGNKNDHEKYQRGHSFPSYQKFQSTSDCMQPQ